MSKMTYEQGSQRELRPEIPSQLRKWITEKIENKVLFQNRLRRELRFCKCISNFRISPADENKKSTQYFIENLDFLVFFFSSGHAALHLAVSVRPSVHGRCYWIATDCITASAQPSATVLPCFLPCFMCTAYLQVHLGQHMTKICTPSVTRDNLLTFFLWQ